MQLATECSAAAELARQSQKAVEDTQKAFGRPEEVIGDMQNASERAPNAMGESQERASSGPPESNGVRRLTIDVSESGTSMVPLELVSLGDGLDNVVSSTSRSFAAYRALESERPDALFRDHLAEYLAGPAALETQRAQLAEGKNPGVRFAVRTKYFDDALMSAVAEIKEATPDAKIQVVIFGCGMDARTWRLPVASSPDTPSSDATSLNAASSDMGQKSSAPTADAAPLVETVFEGDRPDVIKLKRQLLGELEGMGKLPPLRLARRRVMLPINLNDATWQDLLVQEGYRVSEPTVWLFEGLVMYLDPPAVIDLLESAAKLSAPGSVLLVSGISDQAVTRGKQSASLVRRAWTWGCREPEAFFNAHGWHVRKVDDVTKGMYGRELPTTPGREPNLTWYLTAVKV